MPPIQRENSFGDSDAPGSVVITKPMERRIAHGEVALERLESEQCAALNKTLQLLIDTCEPRTPVDSSTLDHCQNIRIAYSGHLLQQLSENRYKERLEGISVANSVQYIRFRPAYLGELPEELRVGILSVFVALALDHIVKCGPGDQCELLKWGKCVMKRLGNMLKLSEIMLNAVTKPIAQFQTLKELQVDVEGMLQKKHHLQALQRYLESSQSDLDAEFKSNVDEARHYLNTPELIQTVKKRSNKGLLVSLSSKLNRVLSRSDSWKRVAVASVEGDNREDEAPAVPRPSSIAYTEDSEGDLDGIGDIADLDVNPNDELLLDSVPGSAVLLRSLVTGYIMSGHNDSRVQLLFQEFSAALGVSSQIVLALENHIASELASAIHSTSLTGTTKKVTRNLKIAAVAAGGGALLALSAGMATPAVAAGLAVLGIGGGGVSGLWATTEEAELLASIFGVGSSGLVGWRGKKVTAKMEFEFHHVNEQYGRSLTVCICVYGYLVPEVDVVVLWEEAIRAPLCDLYALQWESTLLRSLGEMCQQVESQPFAQSAATLWQRYTSDIALTWAIPWPLALIHFATPLDNTWTVAKQRAKQFGAALAYALMDRQAVGERPISLVGYSIGARAIVYALLKLKSHQKLHIVKDVVLMGLPSTAGPTEWAQCRSVVAGRLVNVYSRHDWLLGYLYRYLEPGSSLAGLRPVTSESVENYDATEVIKAHHEYMHRVSDILALVHVDV